MDLFIDSIMFIHSRVVLYLLNHIRFFSLYNMPKPLAFYRPHCWSRYPSVCRYFEESGVRTAIMTGWAWRQSLVKVHAKVAYTMPHLRKKRSPVYKPTVASFRLPPSAPRESTNTETKLEPKAVPSQAPSSHHSRCACGCRMLRLSRLIWYLSR